MEEGKVYRVPIKNDQEAEFTRPGDPTYLPTCFAPI